MSVLIFRLNDVPEEEAQAIRQLLDDNHIDFYETSSGKWGFSVAGIWVKNDDDKSLARELIEAYEEEHNWNMQQRHKAMQESGELESFGSRLRQSPLQVVMYILLAALVVYLTLVPFFSL